MTELRELYQEIILDHNKRPHNYRKIEHANHHLEGYNPLCGDRIGIYMLVEDNIVKDISFYGEGCAISKASASLMTDALKGKKIEEVDQIFEKFHNMVTSGLEEMVNTEELGKLAVFHGVKEFPMRIKCSTLAWHTMYAALKGKAGYEEPDVKLG